MHGTGERRLRRHRNVQSKTKWAGVISSGTIEFVVLEAGNIHDIKMKLPVRGERERERERVRCRKRPRATTPMLACLGNDLPWLSSTRRYTPGHYTGTPTEWHFSRELADIRRELFSRRLSRKYSHHYGISYLSIFLCKPTKLKNNINIFMDNHWIK